MRWLYFAAGITAALTLLGAVAITSAQQQRSLREGMVTITGEVVCLPHKKPSFGLFGGVETQECAIGFRGEDGRHYGLYLEEKDAWLHSTQGSGERFKVSGEIKVQPFQPFDDAYFDRYDIAGVIDVASASTVDGSTSIYEVYARHRQQLIAIAEQIYSQTGAGYSMGIERQAEGRPYIRIVLEEDVPELSKNIPRELEGYKVKVEVRD